MIYFYEEINDLPWVGDEGTRSDYREYCLCRSVAINSIRAFKGSKKTLLMLILWVLQMKIIKKNLVFKYFFV